MQPPPTRKGPYLKVLSNVHKEQLARLQAKNQHECDLLEDIKSFTKQRSAIEKSYAEALLKISNAYLNKKIPSIPDLRDEDGEEQWNVWNVWRTVLEENEKLGKARLAAVEVFQQQITDDAKVIRQIKLASSKKFLDQLSVIQREVQYSVAELDRTKKGYFEEEHLAHDIRDKARDVEEKMKKKKGSIFSSLTALKRESVKVSSKKEVCEEKSTGARNDYLIALAIANAHQDHYYNVDLDSTLRCLENDVYSKLQEYLTVLSRTELLTCSAAQNSFSKIRDQAQMLSREYNVMCCVQYYPVLKQHIRYPFEPCDGDNCTKITCDHGAASILSREAKRWANKIGKEVKTARESQKKVTFFLQLKDAGNKSDPEDANGPDLDTKIEELRDIMRRAMAEKAKAEGVIECLRDGDVNVDEWMQNIESLSTQGLGRTGSSASVKTEDPRRPPIETYYDSDANDDNREVETSSAEPPEREDDIEGSLHRVNDFSSRLSFDDVAQIETERKKIEALSATWDDPTEVDWGDVNAEAPEEAVSSSPPDVTVDTGQSWTNEGPMEPVGVKCVAIYTYSAANPDELSIVENEHLELLGEADEESGWVRARNYKGEEGYVPQNYVEIEAEGEEEGNTSASGFPLQPQISFSSVDYHVQPTTGVDVPELPEETKTKSSMLANGYLDQNEDENQNLPQQEGTPTVPTSVSSGLTTPFINELRAGDGGDFCRALYDYEATTPEELSFYEGQIIKDDDGWWEGEFDGITGVFPEIVVEECRWDGEPLSPMDEDDEGDEEEGSESGIQPPCYTPPEIPAHLLPPENIVVTQPTPDIGHTTPEISVDVPTHQDETEKEKSAAEEETSKPPQPPPPPPMIVTASSSTPWASGFEMELSGDRQLQYNAHLADLKEPDIVVNEMPDITVTVEPDEDETDYGESSQAGSGLDVAQIVITAATPMTDDHKPLPGEQGARGEGGEEESGGSEPSPVAESTDVVDSNSNVQRVELEEEDEEMETSPPPPQKSVFDELEEEEEEENRQKQEDSKQGKVEPEGGSEEEEGGGGWAAFEDNFPKDPDSSSLPRVVEVEVKDSSSKPSEQAQSQQKTSLEIEESVEKTRISLGESNESPVTPEELDVQNLAKLESLKESDA